jgi:ATP-dependent DNA helicase PIF1
MEKLQEVIELSSEQKYAFEKFKRGHNLFITGQGGTGKTRLIKEFVKYANFTGKTIQVCAMTGCASLLLGDGAKTIHSWSGMQLASGSVTKVIDKIIANKKSKKNWTSTDILIVDEVSMCSKKIFEILNGAGKYTRHNNRPFGGIQIVFTGDFYQLPPVPNPREPDTEKFCFESLEWDSVFPIDNCIELKTIFRQKDPVYKNILSEVRRGVISEESIDVLRKYENREYKQEENNGCFLTKILPTRTRVDAINRIMFDKIEEPIQTYTLIEKHDLTSYVETGKPIEDELLELCKEMNKTQIEMEKNRLLNNSPISEILELKKGASVMCLINIDLDQGICNGSQGTVVDFVGEKKIPIVLFANGVQMMIPVNHWQSTDFPTISIAQIPLCLAWALTIHKIQGATLNMAQIDIGKSIFENGQSYVALSRVQSLEGLYLSNFNPGKIKANPKVKEFYSRLPEIIIPQTVEQETPVENKNVKTLCFEEYVYREETQIPLKTDKNIKIVKLK